MASRRTLVLSLGAVAMSAPLIPFAQQQHSRIARIGLLEPASTGGYAEWRRALVAGLRERGYLEGKNIIIDDRGADGNYERLQILATELVGMRVDLIIAASTVAVKAAQQATTAVPIVMVRTADPVGSGLVHSLSRPGRNVTGLSNLALDLSGKYVELLRAAIPKLSRVSVLVNPSNPVHPSWLQRIQMTENSNSIKISSFHAGSSNEFARVFDAIDREHAGALIVLPDSFFFAQAREMASLAAQHRLPTMFGSREPVESGGLMSYGQNYAEHYFRAATYVDKILKGAKPADLPVEQATKIEFVINLKTAKAIGLAIPQDLLLRADRVIE